MPHPGITIARAPGAPSITRVTDQLTLSVTDADERVQRFKGYHQDVASAFNRGAFGLAYNAAHAVYHQDGAIGTADITLKDLTSVVDTVEIDFVSSQRPWHTAPAYVSLTNAEILKVELKFVALEKYAQEAGVTIQDILDTIDDSPLGGILDAALTDLMVNGPTFTAIIPVITFTRAVSNFYGVPFVITDMGKLFTTAQLVAAIPANAQWAVSEVTNTVAANSTQVLGWLKTGRYNITSDGSSNYVQQYVFDSYSATRYSFA